jgi:phosphoribosylaminoimidazolecarboxamide formyltransferase/IMP cyclohydrolase
LGIPVTPVEALTTFPSILGGRVKTLHPKVFGGILGRRGLESDVAQLEEHAIPPIDLVIVDLYPFEATVAAGGSEEETIEKIDIGGISLIRAAAKNFNDVVIVPAQRHYAEILQILREQKGGTTLAQRKAFATHAFGESAHYDRAIHAWFSGEKNEGPDTAGQPVHPLRYGENPHQPAQFIGDLDGLFERLNGKELSYNNLLDLDAAVELIDDLARWKACRSHIEAQQRLRRGSAAHLEGGLGCRPGWRSRERLRRRAHHHRHDRCGYGQGDRPALLRDHLRARLCACGLGGPAEKEEPHHPKAQTGSQARTQIPHRAERHVGTSPGPRGGPRYRHESTATNMAPSAAELHDLEFATILVKHTKSNAIVSGQKSDQLLGSGTGQTSRVDALEQAIAKAKKFNFDLKGAAMASDAFFPFPDCVTIAANSGHRFHRTTGRQHPGPGQHRCL